MADSSLGGQARQTRGGQGDREAVNRRRASQSAIIASACSPRSWLQSIFTTCESAMIGCVSIFEILASASLIRCRLYDRVAHAVPIHTYAGAWQMVFAMSSLASFRMIRRIDLKSAGFLAPTSPVSALESGFAARQQAAEGLCQGRDRSP